MSTNKRYRLLKDLPVTESGTIFIYREDISYYVIQDFGTPVTETGHSYTPGYPKQVVENSKSWFEEILPEPEPILGLDSYRGDFRSENGKLIFTKSEGGKWVVSEYRGEEVTPEQNKVKMNFYHICEDGKLTGYGAAICSRCRGNEGITFQTTQEEFEKMKTFLNQQAPSPSSSIQEEQKPERIEAVGFFFLREHNSGDKFWHRQAYELRVTKKIPKTKFNEIKSAISAALNDELPRDFKERLDGYERFISENLYTKTDLEQAIRSAWKATEDYDSLAEYMSNISL